MAQKSNIFETLKLLNVPFFVTKSMVCFKRNKNEWWIEYHLFIHKNDFNKMKSFKFTSSIDNKNLKERRLNAAEILIFKSLSAFFEIAQKDKDGIVYQLKALNFKEYYNNLQSFRNNVKV